MNCPWCGHLKSGVVKTTHEDVEGESAVVRLRKCGNPECAKHWKTYETYEPRGAERSFDTAEALPFLKRAHDWLGNTARHIPVVRDAQAQLKKGISLISHLPE